jgi:ribosome-associated protein
MRPPDAPPTASRSHRKRADRPLQELARRLAELSEDACRALPVPDGLQQEILASIRTRAHGARNRQIKRVASLLRRQGPEAEALGEVMAGRAARHRAEVQGDKDLETLRERLCDPELAESALGEAVQRFPGLDRVTLQRLARAARAAQGTGDRRPFRAIFRLLRGAQEAERTAEGPGGDA